MKLFALAAASAALLCAQSPLQLPINSLPPETVVAKSPDGSTMTAGEIRRLLESGDPAMISLARQSPDRFIGSVFLQRYFLAEAEKAHIADESPLKEQLQFTRDRILAQAMFTRIRESYAVPEQDIDAFYARNTSRFEQAWIKVIAIAFCPPLTPAAGTSAEDIRQAAKAALENAHCTTKRTEAQAHDQAVGLVGRLRGGADFVKMVAQYSEDSNSKDTEGDFGLVTRDNSFPHEIKDAVFSLSNGDVSGPIRSGSFFYIVKIKEKTVQPLANVREPIIQELKQKHFTDWVGDLEKRFKPVIERPDFFTTSSKGPPQLVPQPE
jgi:PPIC-type PPIASE domain